MDQVTSGHIFIVLLLSIFFCAYINELYVLIYIYCVFLKLQFFIFGRVASGALAEN